MSIRSLQIHTLEDGGAAYAATVTLQGMLKADDLIDQLMKMPGIVSVCEE